MPQSIPEDYPVQPVPENTPGATRCYECGLSWKDWISTSMTPVPSGRCPFEAFHEDPDESLEPGGRIYIDTDTGTWGIDDGNLVIVEATGEIITELMEGVADSTVNEIGKRLDKEQNHA